MSAMDQRQQLLQLICASRQFAHADSLKRILRYVYEQSAIGGNSQLKEYDIAINALGRKKDFDARLDPIVRVSMANLRARLRAFFDTEGALEPLTLVIPKGQYKVVFESHLHKPRSIESHSLRRFWEPYLSSEVHSVLLYTDLLFFRDRRGNYTRNFYLNDPSATEDEIRERIPHAKSGKVWPSYNFLSSGEVHTIFSIMGVFKELGATIEIRNSRYSIWKEMHKCNLILFGGNRTSSFVRRLQGNNDFVIADDSILIRKPRPNENRSYSGYRYADGELEKTTDYVLVTRRPSLSPESAITMISSNHGRAYEGAGRVLTLENELTQVLEKMGLSDLEAMPRHFQILLRVEMADFDEQVVGVEYVSHRVYDAD